MPSPSQPPAQADPIRVMVVDDSAVIRGFLSRIFSTANDISVLASVSDGALAVASLKRQPVDVIVLDIEMPNMDGLTAIPLLLEIAPEIQIVMASTLTTRNADASLAALEAGAADYIAKPSTATSFAGGGEFSNELLQKVRVLGARVKRGQRRVGPTSSVTAVPAKEFALRPWPGIKPKYIAIGSSTGGPQALFEVLRSLGEVAQPIFITQHMPPAFTAVLAQHINRQTGLVCVEGAEGMPVVGGRVHLAPGGWHMSVSNTAKIVLSQEPPENFCRPAVDYMLRGLAATKEPVLTAILTGMGQDGAKGCQPIAAAGGTIIAQDEKSSVVWGMPGAAAITGLCSAVLPLSEIGPKLRQLAAAGEVRLAAS